jgi:hypothetical protein
VNAKLVQVKDHYWYLYPVDQQRKFVSPLSHTVWLAITDAATQRRQKEEKSIVSGLEL